MKKVFALLLTMLMLLSLCACGGNGGGDTQPSGGGDTQSSGDAQPSGGSDEDADNFYLDIKFSNVFQPTEWNYKASEKLAEMITERTEGHITVTYYGQNELDCYGDSVTQAVNNANWMGLEEPSLFADYVGDAATLIGPMLYNSDEEYNYVMESDLVKDVCDRLAAENIHILDTHYSFGFRSVVTNLDIKTPEDLKGHQLRATSSALSKNSYTRVNLNGPTRRLRNSSTAEIFYNLVDSEGYTTTPLNITADEWYAIIRDTSPLIKEYLAAYIQIPDLIASPKEVEQMFNLLPDCINARNTSLGKRAQMMLDIEVYDTDDNTKRCYWSTPILKGRQEDGLFRWIMRPELIEAAMRLSKEEKWDLPQRS